MNDSSGTRVGLVYRILLVEDNDEYRELLGEYLSSFGYQVQGLANGCTFFQTLAQLQPHLVLLDLKLPDIDGFTLLEQIKQKSDWLKLPVIVVSAFAFQADRQRAISLGARRYFVKPVSIIALRQAIHEELGNPTL